MRANSGGFTLLELMVAIAVLAILLAVGLPSYQSLREDNALVGAARVLYADIQLARSEAVKRNSDAIDVKFFSGSSWCYRITDKSDTDCNSCSAICDINGDGLTRGGDVSLFPGVGISDVTYGSDVLGIGARRATMSSGHVTFSLGSKQVKVISSGLGRVRLCNPASGSPSTSISGIASC